MKTNTPKIPAYEIQKKLGHGGMATVYLAVQKPLNRQVALKIMSNTLGEDSVWAQRFIQEAQVIAQLAHPNIVPVFDVGTHDGSFYIAMEYLQGGSLKDRMAKGMPPSDALAVLLAVAAGLDFAGEKGFVHRDIKPDNIMFRDDGSPVILDFGIAKQIANTENKMTQTGVIVGTTTYMSPEQIQGHALDHRSDIYSLGVMFFEMLTGKAPYKGDSDVATLMQHLNEPIPKLPEIFRVLQPVIDKALAKDPMRRYVRSRELIQHLETLEPQIKTMLERIVESHSGAMTIATASLEKNHDPDATLITGAVNTGSFTGEADLTKVISSAKATIRDFSAETRARKLRRAKSFVWGISLTAVVALSIIAYQVLYVIPHEAAVAEEKIRQSELKTKNKIDALLTEAEAAEKKLTPLALSEVDSVTAIYREVLKLDPENKQSQNFLKSFGQRYLDLAKFAIENKDFEKASTYREYAELMIPTHPDLPDLHQAMKALRASQLEKEFIQEEIKTLIEVAKTDIEKSEYFSDEAYTKLMLVLRRDPSNQEAQTLVQTMLNQLYQQTEKNISNRQLDDARKNLDTLTKYYEDQTQVDILKKSLATQQQALSKNQKINQLTKKADRLQREKRTISINDELRESYLAILKLEPDNQQASQGLQNASQYDIKIARQAIEEYDFVRAKKQINTVENFTPNYHELADIKHQLETAQLSNEKANKKLEEAKKLIHSDSQGDKKRRDLLLSYQSIEEARHLDSGNTKIKALISELESAYISEIKKHIQKKDKDLLKAYSDDTKDLAWPSDRIFKLLSMQKESDGKKPRRIIPGGF